MKSLLTGVALLTLSIVPTQAGGWSGCYGSAGAGYSVTDYEVDATSPVFGGLSANIDGLSGDSGKFSLRAGCDMQIQRLVVGVFGGYSWQDDEFEASLTAGGNTFSAAFAIEDQWELGGRAGIAVGKLTDLHSKDSLIYAHVKWVKADVSGISLSGLGGGVPPLNLGSDADGWAYGVGIETYVHGNMTVTFEYTRTEWDDLNTSIPGAVNLDFDPTSNAFMAFVSWRFGGVAPSLDSMP